MDSYMPPFDITNKMFALAAQVMEQLGKLSNVNELERLNI